MRWCLLAVSIGIAAVVGACSSEDDAAPFSFATGDLCEWVSETEVAEFVAAEFDWAGTAAAVDGALDEAVTCQWELVSTSSANGAVIAGDAGLWRDFDGNIYDLDARMGGEGVTDYDGPLDIGAWVLGHPAVSDGVVVHNEGFGQFAFGVPPDRDWLWLSLYLPGSGEWSLDYEARYFAVADRFLEELGWLSAQ